jgi:hypothetical protein
MIQESHFIFRRALAAVPAPQSFAKDWGVTPQTLASRTKKHDWVKKRLTLHHL